MMEYTFKLIIRTYRAAMPFDGHSKGNTREHSLGFLEIDSIWIYKVNVDRSEDPE